MVTPVNKIICAGRNWKRAAKKYNSPNEKAQFNKAFKHHAQPKINASIPATAAIAAALCAGLKALKYFAA